MHRQLTRQSELLLFLSQLLLLLAALAEYLIPMPAGQSLAGSRPEQVIILASFGFCILLNIYAAASIGKVLETEALLNAREALAESFASLAGSIRAQDRDFHHRLREMAFLLEKDRLAELSASLNAVANNIRTLNDPLKADNPVIAALLKAKMAEAGIRQIGLKIDIETSLSGLGPRALDLARIIGNLIDNAFDALQAAGDKTEEKTVEVAIQRTGPFLKIEVSNTGPVIADAAARRIFEPGFSTKGEGHSGLGLHIVKTLTEKMSGTVQLLPDAAGRTRFVVMLPGN